MGAGGNGGREELVFFTGGPDQESRPEQLSGQAGAQCRRPVRACRKRPPWTPLPRPSWAQSLGSRITSGVEHPIPINEKDLEGSQGKSQSWDCPPPTGGDILEQGRWGRHAAASCLRSHLHPSGQSAASPGSSSGLSLPRVALGGTCLGTQVGLLLLQPPHCVHQEGPLSESQEAWHVGGRQANHAIVLIQHLSQGGQVTGRGMARAAGLPAPFTHRSFSLPAPVSQARPTSPFSASSIWEVGTRKDEAIALRMWPGSHLACARPTLGCCLLSQSQSGLCGGPKMTKCHHCV